MEGTKNGIYVSQRKYTLDLLQETGMLGCKATNTPTKQIKGREDESHSTDKYRYQSLVGKLICLSHTRPNIGFTVSLDSRYMSTPTESNIKMANRILQYLKGTPNRGLHFKKNSNRGIYRLRLDRVLYRQKINYKLLFICVGKPSNLEKQETICSDEE